METELRTIMLSMATTFAEAEGCSISTIARRCKNNPNFFVRLQDTTTSFTTRTYDEVMSWFLKNWPTGSQKPYELMRWSAGFQALHPRAVPSALTHVHAHEGQS